MNWEKDEKKKNILQNNIIYFTSINKKTKRGIFNFNITKSHEQHNKFIENRDLIHHLKKKTTTLKTLGW